jgi:hypothetical protein
MQWPVDAASAKPRDWIDDEFRMGTATKLTLDAGAAG